MEEKIITGNYFNKYGSQNPLYKKLMANFTQHIIELIKSTGIQSPDILEVGCGEGHLAGILTSKINEAKYEGFDIDDELVVLAKSNCKKGNFTVGSVYALSPYSHRKTDITVVSEVLEHLDQPEKALKELEKLNTRYYLFSIPNEPIWRMLNMMRFKYLKSFGNTPGHLQHWGKKSFKNLLSSHFSIVEFNGVFPWIISLCKKKNN